MQKYENLQKINRGTHMKNTVKEGKIKFCEKS